MTWSFYNFSFIYEKKEIGKKKQIIFPCQCGKYGLVQLLDTLKNKLVYSLVFINKNIAHFTQNFHKW